MIARLKEVWTRHDDWTPKWSQRLWRALIIFMMALLLANLFFGTKAIVTGSIWDGILNLVAAAWIIFLLLFRP